MPRQALLKSARHRDRLFEKTASRASDFQFTEEVAEVFDDMLIRSVPLYLEQQMIIQELGKRFYAPGTAGYDLGCSTGTTLINLGRELMDQHPRLIGYDNSLPMVEKARERIRRRNLETVVEVRCGDIEEIPLEPASLMTLCWTLQFIRPLDRERLIRRLYESLVSGGALIITEKVLTGSPATNQLFIDRYYEFKKRNGYSNEEIARKREALENVLVPFRIDENVRLFRRAGFQIVDTFFQWYNFAGFLCVKRPGRRGGVVA